MSRSATYIYGWMDEWMNGWICGKTSIIDVNGTTQGGEGISVSCLPFPYVQTFHNKMLKLKNLDILK